MLKKILNILHRTHRSFYISEIFVFANFLHSNSYELVEFCGRSLRDYIVYSYLLVCSG